jgi:LppP/LprE lipoprotein
MRLRTGPLLADSAMRIAVQVDNRGRRCRPGRPVTAAVEGSAATARIKGNPYRVKGVTWIRSGRTRLPTVTWVNWCGHSHSLTIAVRYDDTVARVPVRNGPECLDSGTPSRLGPDLRARSIALVLKKGYVANPSTWDDFFAFNVLIGTYRHSADGYNKRAFFFLGDRYLGTDARRPSAQVQEVWRDDRRIALLYTLYRRSDALCCPTAGGAIVRFDLNRTRVVARDRIPPTWPARVWR